MPAFNYTLSGTIEAPEGSRLSHSGTRIILPDGRGIKIWEQLEISTVDEDDHEDLTSVEAEALGIFYDGDLCRFDEGSDD